MEITKRNGTTEPYDREKIAVAIRKSFASTGQEVSNEIIYSVVEEVENFVGKDTANRSVEQIQDKVEQMSDGTRLLCRGQKLHTLPLATD